MAYSTTVTQAITAQNQFTGWAQVSAKKGMVNSFSAFLANDSSFVGTWSIEARRRISENSDGTVTYGTTIRLKTDTVEGVYTAQLVGPWEIRAGVRTGEYTSGSATVGVCWA
jgi:hypothetical protein